jgi:hypothetical protein
VSGDTLASLVVMLTRKRCPSSAATLLLQIVGRRSPTND